MISNIFTFTSIGAFPQGYIKIHAKDNEACRREMFRLFSDRWAFQYANEKDAGIEEFGFKLIEEYYVDEY